MDRSHRPGTKEVLGQQPEHIQTFLLRTSILDRLCGPLCHAVVMDPAGSGQETLAYLEHANLFIVPLDNERRWYRYHHLFADLLRQRLHQHIASTPEDDWNLYYALFTAIEIACLLFILWYAWTWRQPEGAVLPSAQSSVYEQGERAGRASYKHANE